MPTAPPDESQKAPVFDNLDSTNLSSIERASFLEAVQQNYGNPLHSTAVEEDLSLPEEGGTDGGGGKGAPQTGRTAVQRKEKGRDGGNKEEKKKSGNIGRKARPGKTRKKEAIEEEAGEADVEGEESEPGPAPKKSSRPIPSSSEVTDSGTKRLVGKRPAKRRSAGQRSAARPAKNEGLKKEKKRKKKSGSGESSGPQSQEASDPDPAQKSRRPIPSSDEVTDEDTSWTPSRKRARTYNLDGFRKSSSDRSTSRKSSASGSAEGEEASRGQQREKRHGRRGETELEVVLDAFLDFCHQYRESVESTTVRQAIDSLSSSVEEQLTEKITASKDLRVLRKNNAKVGSLIRRKRQRLLDAKYELIRAEQQLRSLQKEEARLELRLADLRRGQAFLRGIRELNRGYLEHRHTHPKEKEEYGASSLPALLLETKYVLGAEHQLRGINNRLAKRLDETGK
ncbi:centromere protein U [Centroberyx affinis]|uniref:centromere protein U n=1 Tax=Centroberyx affinis TaxID=166261 RepID=UPI003A5BC55C